MVVQIQQYVTPQSEATPPSFLTKTRLELGDGFKQLADLISHVRKPLPLETGNGTDSGSKEDADMMTLIEGGLKDLWKRGVAGSYSDISTLLEVQQKGLMGAMIDDKTYLMERLIKVAAELPDGSALGKKVTDTFVTQLWNDLGHPPQSYLGAKYQYRSADGSCNSFVNPDMGKAGTPYARTVAPQTMRAGAAPDPEVVFDSVLIRKHNDKHPNGISSMLFYLASIIIHDLFRTNHRDFSISDTSSYLDLSPLYGSNEDEQKMMRGDPKKMRGHIKPDCFSETRLLTFPPGVGTLLIMFNRFHNHVVDRLAAINEGSQFKYPGENGTDANWKKYDEDLFQTARLITCGLYINIILIDYVRTILNLNKTDTNWQLNPRVDIKNGPPKGVGNQVSAEFNLVYRWHSTISDRDEKWTEELFERLFPGKDPLTMDWHVFIKAVTEMQDKTPKDPLQRDFHNVKRNADGTLPDDDLVKILTESIEDCANAYGANRVPGVMRVIEVLGIQQARAWNVATLNEFRKHFGLTPHKTFEDINSDPEVADQLKNLYDHPDLVELYPGLVVEEPKVPLVPASGLCPPYAVSRGVLSDAVAVVRGDRFYTIDYHPRKLTNWGFSEAKSDLEIDNGCVFYKLFLRAFPDHFDTNSVYAHYPLTIPTEMEKTLNVLGKAQKYSFNRPTQHATKPRVTLSYSAADSILANQQIFRTPYGKAMDLLRGEHTKYSVYASESQASLPSRKLMSQALYMDGWAKKVRSYYESTTTKLIKEKSYRLAGIKQVDIIRDVTNIVPVNFCAELFGFPLKTAERPNGYFTEVELYLVLSSIFVCVFFDLDPAESFALRQKANKATQFLGDAVAAHLDEYKRGGVIHWLSSKLTTQQASPLKDYSQHVIDTLIGSKLDTETIVWGHILGTVGGLAPKQAQLFGQIMDYFMSEGKEHVPNIRHLALQPYDDEEAFDLLTKYVLEASRLNGETGVFRTAASDVVIQDSLNGNQREVPLQKGDRVMVNIKSASRDPAIFPEPDKLRLNRPIDSYIHLGWGSEEGLPLMRVALTAMLRAVARLDNLRAVKGPQGKVAKVVGKLPGQDEEVPLSAEYHQYLTENWDQFWPFPTSLKVNWTDHDYSRRTIGNGVTGANGYVNGH